MCITWVRKTQLKIVGGTRLSSWLGYRATYLKDDGSIPYFAFTYSFRPHCCPGVDSASKRNEYRDYFLGGKGGRCVVLTTLPPSRADCLEAWDFQPPATPRAYPDLYRNYFTFIKIGYGYKREKYVWLAVLPRLLHILFKYFTSFVIPDL